MMCRGLAWLVIALAACDDQAGLAPDGGAPDATLPTVITGTVVVRDRVTREDVVVNLTDQRTARVWAIIRRVDGTIVERDADGNADGTFTITGLPAGTVQVAVRHEEYGTVYCQSDSRVFHVVLSGWGQKRLLPSNLDTTGLQVAVDDLVAWDANDTLDIVVEQFGLQFENVGARLPTTPLPSAGATSFEFRSTGWYAELIDSRLGDVAFLLQMRSTSGVKAVIAGVQLPPFTMSDAAITHLTASLVALGGRHVQVPITLSAFRDLAVAAQGAGIPDPAEIMTHVSLTAGRVSLVSASGLSGDLVLDTEYGDPLPLDLERTLTVWGRTLIAGTPASWTSVRIPVDDLGQGLTILPGVGAVRDVQIGTGLTPVVSWSAPTFGAPILYRVAIMKDRHEIAAILTDDTMAFIPPGVLVPLQPYRPSITAWVGDRSPYVWERAPSTAETTSVTPAFVP